MQQKKDNQRLIANRSNKESDKQLHKDTKKQLKAEIKGIKALLSKNLKKVWGTIYRILKSNPQRIKVNPKALNEYCSTLGTKLTGNTKQQ